MYLFLHGLELTSSYLNVFKYLCFEVWSVSPQLISPLDYDDFMPPIHSSLLEMLQSYNLLGHLWSQLQRLRLSHLTLVHLFFCFTWFMLVSNIYKFFESFGSELKSELLVHWLQIYNFLKFEKQFKTILMKSFKYEFVFISFSFFLFCLVFLYHFSFQFTII